MKSYTIASETADKLRAAAPALGLTVSASCEIVGPGMEALYLDEFAAMKFDAMRKAAKVSPDTLINRILKGIAPSVGVSS